MGMTLIYGLLILLILLLIGLIVLIVSLKKKSISGILISVLLITPIFSVLLANTFDELSISKNDVISELKHLGVVLKDDFKIVDNKVTGMPERYQETEITISIADRNRIIKVISEAENFKSFKNDEEIATDTTYEQFYNSNKILNLKYPEFYRKEISKEIDHISTRISLTVYEKDNVIIYQRIED
ncbi:hypothetical protein D3C87_740260 [compost metagenome]